MIEIELDVFWTTPETKNLQDAGLGVELDEKVTKKHTFYVINFIRPYKEKYCDVIFGDVEFIVNHTYAEVKQMIKDQLNFKWN